MRKISYNFVYSAISYRGLSPEEAVHEIVNRDDTIVSYGRKKFNSIKSLYTFLNRFDKIKATYGVFARHYSTLSTEEFRTKYNLDRKINSVSPDVSMAINSVKSLKKNRFIMEREPIFSRTSLWKFRFKIWGLYSFVRNLPGFRSYRKKRWSHM